MFVLPLSRDWSYYFQKYVIRSQIFLTFAFYLYLINSFWHMTNFIMASFIRQMCEWDLRSEVCQY